MIFVERGIHTVELYLNQMPYAEVQTIVEDLYHLQRQTGETLIVQTKKDHLNVRGAYEVHGYWPEGMLMKVYQESQRPSAIRFILNPSTLTSGEYVPERLYWPEMLYWSKKKFLKQMVKFIQEEFENTKQHRKWQFDVERLSLSRVDITWNLYFPREVDLTEVIRLFKHGYRKKKDRVVTFRDAKKDRHSFRVMYPDVVLTVYDKSFQVRQKHWETREEMQILRIELSLKRSAYLRMLKLPVNVDYDEVLQDAVISMSKVLKKYTKRMFPCVGRHLPYPTAVKEIQEKVADEELREKMLFLLNKTSRSDSLSMAMEKTMMEYGMGKKEMEKLLKKFDKVDVNPITFKKDSKMKELPGVRKMLL